MVSGVLSYSGVSRQVFPFSCREATCDGCLFALTSLGTLDSPIDILGELLAARRGFTDEEYMMAVSWRAALKSQLTAAIKMVAGCVEECPDEMWDALIVNHSFNQTAFHALFFADVYLGTNLAALREQEFHRRYISDFGDYEELEDRKPKRRYGRSFLRAYAEHCIQKVDAALTAESDDDLSRTPGFDWLSYPRAEVHLSNLRHLQHHAGQLSMRLRLDTGSGTDWVFSGDGRR